MDNAQQNNNNKKTTPAQFSVLVKEMENNPNIGQSLPAFGYTTTKRETFWNGLAFKLNALGPKQRTTSEWKKVWSELKLRTKRKIADNSATLTDIESGTNNKTDTSCDGHMLYQALHVRGDIPTPSVNSLRVHEDASTSNPILPSDSKFFLGHTSIKNECESRELFKRQADNEENLIAALNRSNELKQQQLELMEEQNKLIGAAIECVTSLSLKLVEFVENNSK